MEWIVGAKIPQFEDRYFFDVWVGDSVRRVQRVGNRGPLSLTFAPGTLVFSDCTHPSQNMICGEDLVDGWRLREDLPTLQKLGLGLQLAPEAVVD